MCDPLNTIPSRWFLLPVLLWLLMSLAAWPVGEFPLNDDWSYAGSVHGLVERGEFVLTGWTSMPLVAQAAWGALFCLPFGFSFLALRVSTLVLGLVGILATYGLAREAGASRNRACLLALLLAANPLYFVLANTFMTDVPFLATAVSSLFLLARGIRTRSPVLLAAGIATATVATLIRQVGVVIPVAFTIAWFFHNRRQGTARRIWIPVSSIVAVWGSLAVYEWWLRLSGRLPALYHEKTRELLARLSDPLASAPSCCGNLLASAAYLGPFLLPLMFLLQPLVVTRRKLNLAILAACGVTVAILVFSATLMPFLGNILYNIGLGPIRLRDVHLLKLAHWPAAPAWVQILVTVIAVAAGAYLLVRLALLRRVKDDRGGTVVTNPAVILCAATAALYVLPLAMGSMFDRYLVFLVPLVGALISGGESTAAALCLRSRKAAGVAVLVVLALFSVGATRDYLAWNRARWAAADELIRQQNVPASQIDGGFEFNGWYGYDAAHPRGLPEDGPTSWWWVKDAEYVIAMGPIPGYRTVSQYDFSRLIPPGHGAIVVLRKDTTTAR